MLLLSHHNVDVNSKYIYIRGNLSVKAESNCYIDIKDDMDCISPLHLATRNKNIEIIKLLLSRPDLDINIKYHSEFRFTAFSLLAFKLFTGGPNGDSSPTLDFFSELKIPLNKSVCKCAQFIEEKSVLHLAVENENIEIIKLLLTRSELDINAKTFKEEKKELTLTEAEMTELQEKMPMIFEELQRNTGICEPRIEDTALHIAVKNKNIEIIKLLLDNNIDVEKKNAEGQKPTEITDSQEIKSILEKPKH